MLKQIFEFQPISNLSSSTDESNIGENGFLEQSTKYNVWAEAARIATEYFFQRCFVKLYVLANDFPAIAIFLNSFANIILQVKQVDFTRVCLNLIMLR